MAQTRRSLSEMIKVDWKIIKNYKGDDIDIYLFSKSDSVVVHHKSEWYQSQVLGSHAGPWKLQMRRWFGHDLEGYSTKWASGN